MPIAEAPGKFASLPITSITAWGRRSSRATQNLRGHVVADSAHESEERPDRDTGHTQGQGYVQKGLPT